MIDVKFTIDGRDVSPDQLTDALTRAVPEQARDYVTSRLSSVRRPEHNQFARVEVSGTSLENLSLNVYGCCEKLQQAAVRAWS